MKGVFINLVRLSDLGYAALFSQDAFFLKRTDGLSTQNHRNFLTFNHEGFLLKVRLEDSLSATQRKADIVAKLFAFSGEFTSCCHKIYYFHLLFTICTSLPLLRDSVKVKSTLLVLAESINYTEVE